VGRRIQRLRAFAAIELVHKVKEAVAARDDPDFAIIARTNACPTSTPLCVGPRRIEPPARTCSSCCLATPIRPLSSVAESRGRCAT
jgi:hypothetical protein